MKAIAFLVLFAVCAIECRKIVPINKNANIDFINMESGGARPAPAARPAAPAPAPVKPQSPTPVQPKTPVVTSPVITTPKAVVVQMPTVPPAKEIKPTVPKPAQPAPNQDLEWKPLPPKSPASTPGYGSVKQLVTYYDSKGQASVIRPYSYSDAVKKQ